MERVVYLDNNATTMVAPEVLDAMLPFFKDRYGNPSSMHSFGGLVAKDMLRAREQVARLLGADNDFEITFTGTATESDNIAIRGILGYYKEKKHVITSTTEHPAVLNLCKQLEKEGYRVTFVPVGSDGVVDVEFLKNSVTEDTAIVSIMHANNETGVINPVEEIGAFLKERGIPFHVDGVQAAGKIPVDVNKINCDLYSISAHKFHGPKGVGALYVRKGTRMRPLIYGGHQEKGRRPGTENVSGVVGMGKAAELALLHLKDMPKVAALRDKLQKGILEKIKTASINGAIDKRTPNTLNASFEFIEGESILLYLDRKGICVSTGSACSSGSLEPSHVLRAMNIPFSKIHGSVRFSLSRYTTEEDIDYTLQELPGVVETLLTISPFWDNEKKVGKIF
ncbi:MAG TPA: cysteine desulfurase NifS [Spirochaetota bacterium]|nr:cysteine desulfurase NifS [Spirochaetota bacterium]HOV09146.1 cysteine desulfurase NifS [Spirochaetota bacterium]HPD77801.1 cysteine desulfurase NifS [Spirochaetota bacterium]HPP96065.1 cysteine desulfurase NifS [Spirochaetota bacterium]HRS62301.1 cysteine desulfurase NifS [Spirochaetota bacterium]